MSPRILTQDDGVDPFDAAELEPCSVCGGEGVCDDGADPLLTCPEDPHPCHSCGGSGNAKDQRYW